MLDTRSLNLTLDFCLRVGELLLSSGAGAADVTATMHSLAWHLGVRNPEIDVTFTSLSMSYQPDPEEPAVDPDPAGQAARHRLRGPHPRRPPGPRRGQRRLSTSRRPAPARPGSSRPGHTLPRWAVTLGWGADVRRGRPDARRQRGSSSRIAFARGDLHRPAAAGDGAAAAPVLLPAGRRRRRRDAPRRRRPPASPLDVDPSLVVTANIIMLLAGIGFMGALQDALSGFYVTAGARLTRRCSRPPGIIAGVSGGLHRRRGRSASRSAGSSPGAVGLGERHRDGRGRRPLRGAFAFASYAPRRIIAADRAARRGRDGDLAVDRDPGLRPRLADRRSPRSSSGW